MMNSRKKQFVVTLLFLSFLLISQNPYYSTPAQTDNWILLAVDPLRDVLLAKVAQDEESQDGGELLKGNYTCTHKSDSRREYLRETEVYGGYRLSWVYTFDLGPPKRDETHFYIAARTTEDDGNEKMSVWWSINKNGPWGFFGYVSPAPERLYGPWKINNNTISTIYIKIKDTIKDDPKRSGILIDHMYVACLLKEADIKEVYFCNNGTYAFFNVTLSGQPNPRLFTYVVCLDKPSERTYKEDFRLVYASSGGELQRWNEEEGWIKQDDITVIDSSSPNGICFNVPLGSIANPDIQEDTRLWFVVYYGTDDYTTVLDRAPDRGEYFIYSEIIPELPWPMPLFFIPAVIVSIYVLHQRRFR